MSKEKYPNIAGLFGVLDGLLGCAWALLQLVVYGVILVWIIGAMFG
jgi:hypothetical protein